MGRLTGNEVGGQYRTPIRGQMLTPIDTLTIEASPPLGLRQAAKVGHLAALRGLLWRANDKLRIGRSRKLSRCDDIGRSELWHLYRSR